MLATMWLRYASSSCFRRWTTCSSSHIISTARGFVVVPMFLQRVGKGRERKGESQTPGKHPDSKQSHVSRAMQTITVPSPPVRACRCPSPARRGGRGGSWAGGAGAAWRPARGRRRGAASPGRGTRGSCLFIGGGGGGVGRGRLVGWLVGWWGE